MRPSKQYLTFLSRLLFVFICSNALTISSGMTAVVSEPEKLMVVETANSPTVSSLMDKIKPKRIVYVGESHSSVEDHMLQLKVLESMAADGQPLAIGVEWFQQPFQSTVDAYISGEIDEAQLLKDTEYFKRWGFDYRLFRPIMQFARKHNIPVLALNASREVTSAITKSGIKGLSNELREQLPAKYDFSESSYTELLGSMFGKTNGEGKAHGHEGGFRRFLEVQLTWDETMADNISEFLQKHEEHRIIVFAGRGHTHEGAIPARVARRTGIEGVSILNFQPHTPFNSADYLVLAEQQQLPPAAIMGVMVSDRDSGVFIDDFSSGSLAAEAGIQKEDRILAVDDAVVNSIVDLKLSLLDHQPGDTVTVLLLRKPAESDKDDESLKVQLELIRR